MAARKSTTKKAASKPAKKAATKPAAKKAASKPAAKPATKKAAAKPAKKAAAQPAKKAASKPAKQAAEPKAEAAKPKASKGGDVSPEGVNMGHVFALRPRVTTAFPPDAFRRAKEDLAEERFASIQEAARAVAEKALETSQKKPNKHGMRR
jgi:hypothetical protein